MSTRVAVPDTAPPWTRLILAASADGETLRVQVAGELDLATAPQLAPRLTALGEGCAAIRLDLTRVTFVDLAGLRALLDARRDARTRGERLHIGPPGLACACLLELTRTTYLLGPD